jgi:phage major head subunit gpT-like protein
MIIRTQYPDLFLADALPAIDDVIFVRFNRFPPQYSRIFRTKGSKRSIEQTTELTGLGTFNEVPEGQNVNYDFAVPGFDKTFTHLQYGLGFAISRIMADDDRWAIIAKLSSDLGRSARETIELHAATVFNDGFSDTGPDGVSLFDGSHPLVKSGGTQSNILSAAADLDIPSLELALTDFRLMKDPAGKKARIPPRRLVIPPQLEWRAAEMLTGNMRSDTANHTVNAFRHRVGMSNFDDIVIWEYLTDPDAWFVLGDKEDTELRWYWRERPGTVHDVHFDSRTLKTAMWMRYSYGYSNFYGTYGTPGA